MITVVDNLFDGVVGEESDPIYTFTFTVSASAEILIIAVAIYGANTAVETMTWGGDSMTIDLQKNNLGTECVIAHLLNPRTGKLNLEIGVTGDVSSANIGIISATGVSNTNPVNSSAFFNTDSAEGHSLDITTTKDRCLIVDCVQSGAVISLAGSETIVLQDETNDVSGCQYYEQGSSGLKSMVWSWEGDDTTTHIAVAFESESIVDVINNNNLVLNLDVNNDSPRINISSSSNQNLTIKKNNLNLKV